MVSPDYNIYASIFIDRSIQSDVRSRENRGSPVRMPPETGIIHTARSSALSSPPSLLTLLLSMIYQGHLETILSISTSPPHLRAHKSTYTHAVSVVNLNTRVWGATESSSNALDVAGLSLQMHNLIMIKKAMETVACILLGIKLVSGQPISRPNFHPLSWQYHASVWIKSFGMPTGH